MQRIVIMLSASGLAISGGILLGGTWGLWRPSPIISMGVAFLFPLFHLMSATLLALKTKQKEPDHRLIWDPSFWGHLACIPVSGWFMLQILVMKQVLPQPILLVPNFIATFGWLVVIPLSIAGYALSKRWSDLSPIAVYLVAAAAVFPGVISGV